MRRSAISAPRGITDPMGGVSLIILAVDTASSFGGVAILDDESGELAECRVGRAKRQFSEGVTDMIGLCLSNMSLTIDDIDCLAVTAGPGSFTGLRVGLSVIKGLAFATGKPVITVSSLLAHAWMFPYVNGQVCALLDARKREVYAAVYRWDGKEFATVVGEHAYRIDDLLARISGPTIFVGDGIRMYRASIEEALGSDSRIADDHLAGCLPSCVARLASTKAHQGEYTDIISLSPRYLRRPEAEIKSEGNS